MAIYIFVFEDVHVYSIAMCPSHAFKQRDDCRRRRRHNWNRFLINLSQPFFFFRKHINCNIVSPTIFLFFTLLLPFIHPSIIWFSYSYMQQSWQILATFCFSISAVFSAYFSYSILFQIRSIHRLYDLFLLRMRYLPILLRYPRVLFQLPPQDNQWAKININILKLFHSPLLQPLDQEVFKLLLRYHSNLFMPQVVTALREAPLYQEVGNVYLLRSRARSRLLVNNKLRSTKDEV